MCVPAHSRALLVLVALATVASINPAPKGSSKIALEELIRRQLMENNYDYISFESEEKPVGQQRRLKASVTSAKPKRLFRAHDDVETDSGTSDEPEQIDDDRQSDLSQASPRRVRAQNNAEQLNRTHQDVAQVSLTSSNLNDKPKHTTTASTLVPTKTNKEDEQIQSIIKRPNEIYNIKNSREVHKNDLLYYISDDHFRRDNVDGDRESSEEQGPTTSTVQYKVFTVKTSGGGDARGSDSTNDSGRVFVREHRSGEVVLVRLDDQPFPEFRLPAARRQYMEEEGPALE